MSSLLAGDERSTTSKDHRENCRGCGKPLGNSADGRCYTCGGETYRSGKRIAAREWQVLLGVGGSA